MTGYEQALAEIRALPSTPRTEPTPSCCNGRRVDYQTHLRRGEDPCAESRAANAAYSAAYQLKHRPKKPRRKVAFRVGDVTKRFEITPTRDEPDGKTVFPSLIKAKNRAVELARDERNAWNQQINALRCATHDSVGDPT